jgi:hypothetical protein
VERIAGDGVANDFGNEVPMVIIVTVNRSGNVTTFGVKLFGHFLVFFNLVKNHDLACAILRKLSQCFTFSEVRELFGALCPQLVHLAIKFSLDLGYIRSKSKKFHFHFIGIESEQVLSYGQHILCCENSYNSQYYNLHWLKLG